MKNISLQITLLFTHFKFKKKENVNKKKTSLKMATTKAVSISVATGKPKQGMITILKNIISKVNVKETFKDIFEKVKKEFLSEIAEPMQQIKAIISTKFGFGSDDSNL